MKWYLTSSTFHMFSHNSTKLGTVRAQSSLNLCDPWAVAHEALLSKEFSRQEYWSGLPFPSLGDLPKPRN